MKNRNASELGYSLSQKIAHWGIVVLCVVEFPTAAAIQRAQLGRVFGIQASNLDTFFATAHEWVGWLILGLAVLLLLSRLAHGAPALPAGMKPWQRALAHSAHTMIYLGLVALVTSGAAAMYLSGRFAYVHVLLSKAGIGLISMHVIAVGWHQAIRRDGLLKRMWFFPSRKQVESPP